MDCNNFRICIFNGDMSKGGGTERISSVLANALTDNTCWTIYVLSLNNDSGESYFPLNSSVRHFVLRKSGIKQKMLELHRFLRKERIDIIIDVDIMLAIYSVPASIFTNTKIISWEMFNIRNDIGSRHTKMVRQYLLKHGAYYVNQTEGDMNAFKKEMKVQCPITFIHNPVEYDENYTGYDAESRIIVTAGHFFYTKGYDLAIEVAKLVFAKHPDWEWHFYGDGNELEKCKAKVAEYGLEKNVIFCGRTKNIVDEYKKAAMYVMTSRTEGFGLVLTEAKACNLPTLAFDCEFGPREIIEDGVSGYLVPAYDVSQMAEKVSVLIENTEKRIAFSNNSRGNFYRFSLKLFVKKWIGIISDL